MAALPRHPYQSRSISFLELWYHAGWRIKVYGIAHDAEHPAPELIERAREIAAATLPQPAITTDRYGVGFMGIHQGRDANLVFVDWWENENELHHHVFVSSLEQLGAFTNATSTGLCACVWDLAVIGFERQSWVASVLQAPGGANLSKYLSSRFDGMV